MTDSAFDPYRDWLGLATRPTNPYELLQLPVGETDAERIDSAATQALSLLRSVRPGQRQEQWKQLLDELEAARACLSSGLDQARSQSLRRVPAASGTTADTRMSPPTSGFRADVDPMAPVEFAAPPANGWAHRPDSNPVPRSDSNRPPDGRSDERILDVRPAARTRRVAGAARRRSSRWPGTVRPLVAYGLLAICFGTVFGALVGVFYWQIQPARESRLQRLAAIPQSAADLPLPAEASVLGNEPVPLEPDRARAPQEPARTAAEPVRFSVPANLSDPHDLPPNATEQPERAARAAATKSALSPADLQQLDDLLREAYRALRERRWTDAEKSLRQARSFAASTADEPRVERFATLADYAHQYHQAFEEGLRDLTGSELVIGGKQAFVVEAGAEQLVLRMEGQNRRFPRDRLPTRLLMAIADRWFDQRAATTGVFRGAYMLVTPEFSSPEVRAIWQAADRSGAPLGDLPQVLDDLESLGGE